MMMRIRPWILGVVFASSALCAQTPIESAFDQLYRFHFSSAYQILDTYIAQNPDDPLGYSTRASVLLFEELNSLQLLESEFFEDDKRIIDKKKLKPDPVLKARFMQAIDEAQRRAKGRPGHFRRWPARRDVVEKQVAISFALATSSYLTGKRAVRNSRRWTCCFCFKAFRV